MPDPDALEAHSLPEAARRGLDRRGREHGLVTEAALAALTLGVAGAASAVLQPARLPSRIARIVLHVPGGPSYDKPERRWRFLPPPETQALWKSTFGAHLIVWTDGSVWPRHPKRGEPPSYVPPLDGPADEAWRRRLAEEATPVYSQLHHGNSRSMGIEVSHSGRRGDPLPRAQIRSLAWLLRTLLDMSEGRLTPAAIVGHKDLDRRPAYLRERCSRPGCAVFVDSEGQAYRRRVDPPESVFAALAAEGLAIPRPAGDGDAELRRAEGVPAGIRPAVAAR